MTSHPGVYATAANPAVPDPRCYILKCPPEILMMFSEALGHNMASRAAFSQSCRAIQDVTEEDIYRDDVRYHQASAMSWAPSSDSLATLKKSVARGANIFTPRRRPLLHDAAAHGSNAVVKYLLDRGVDIHEEARICKCKSPCAFPREGYVARVGRPLIIPGRTTPRWTALHVAICKGHTSTAKLLMDHGALEHPSDPLVLRQVAIRQAAVRGQHQLLDRILLGKQADIHAIIGTTDRPKDEEVRRPTICDYGALWFALSPMGNIETFDALVALGADVHERPHLGIVGEFGENLIDRAFSRNYLEMANALFRHGARPENWNSVNGCSRLLRSILSRIISEMILEKNYTKEKESLYIVKHSTQLARSLVATGADFYHEYTEATTRRGIDPTPPNGLVISASACSERDAALLVMAFLLEMGATVGEVDSSGKTALAILIEAFQDHMWRDIGPGPDAPEETEHLLRGGNSTQLRIWPKERRLFAAVEMMLQHGASPMSPVKGYSGQTIMELVIGQFPLMEHNYEGHQAARAGINAIKLVWLFLKYQHSFDLSFHTIAVLEIWAKDAIAAMQKKPPVTDLSPQIKETFCFLSWHGLEKLYESCHGQIPGDQAEDTHTTWRPGMEAPYTEEGIEEIVDDEETIWNSEEYDEYGSDEDENEDEDEEGDGDEVQDADEEEDLM